MRKIANLLVFSLIVILMVATTSTAAVPSDDFVRVRGTHFYQGKNDTPYYFMGTNLWYGPILGSTGPGGNRQRLCSELDRLAEAGVRNLRILVGADEGSANANTVVPVLQPRSGELNETLLVGLDYMLTEMAEREMLAVIYLTNSWDWSGGYGFYLREDGAGDSPDARGEGYNDYVAYARRFYHSEKAKTLYYDHIKKIVSRTNSITGRPYKDDPTIMSWQLCNEPRPFGKEEAPAFLEWVEKSAALIKSIDPNHLVSTGSEGVIGCNVSRELCEQVHALADIDYMTVHIWPANWGWAKKDSLYESLPAVLEETKKYLSLHDRISRRIRKPYVVEEFGYPRDRSAYEPGTTTAARDVFYRYVFSRLRESRENGTPMAGCNFWGWGGEGRPAAWEWKPGDDYLCDPPHEPQGWYSVFNTDASTIELITNALKP